MTRREVIMIAERINGLAIAPEARSHVTTQFASMLAGSLPDFDRSLFVTLCDPYRTLRAEAEVEPGAEAA
jgi:hypothetical protein